jgi:hypothetical protein
MAATAATEELYPSALKGLPQKALNNLKQKWNGQSEDDGNDEDDEISELKRLLASARLPGVRAALTALLVEKEKEKVITIDDATTAYDFLTNYLLDDKKSIAEVYMIEPHVSIQKMFILLFCLLNKDRKTIVLSEDNTLISSSITELLKAITFNKLKGHLEFREFTNTDAPYCEFTTPSRTYIDFDNLDTIGDELGVIMFIENQEDEITYINEDNHDSNPEIYVMTEDVIPFLQSFHENILRNARQHHIVPRQEFEDQYEGALAKPILNLQLHQEIIVTGVCNQISASGAAAAEVNNKFLVGVLPRGGKTYIAGGIIREYMKRALTTNPEKSLNIIWITATPNETKSQVGKDLIEKFQDLNDFVFIGYPFMPSAACGTEEVCRSTKKHSVIFCSTQFLINPSSTGKAFLQGMITNADMFFFDEAHKTGSGKQTKAKIESIIGIKPTVFLTATYYSTIEDYGISRNNTFIWDYVDVKQTRKLDKLPENLTQISENYAIEQTISDSSGIKHQELANATAEWQAAKQIINENPAVVNLKRRFGAELVEPIVLKRIANGETPRAIARDYNNFPNLNFISHDMPADMIPIKDMFEKADKVRLESLVSIVGQTLEYITLYCKQEATKSRFSFENHDTILMFVPTCTKMGIEKVMKTWATTLLENRKFKLYEVACILDEGGEDEVCEVGPAAAVAPVNTRAMNLFGNQPALASRAEQSIMKNYRYGEQPDVSLRIRFLQNTKEKDIKQQIQDIENDVQFHNAGLIVLAGSKLSTGVSLPCTDVVFLLNDDKSEDTVIQKMYRALTPSRGKNQTFVVDYNPVRSFASIYGYTLLASGEEQKFIEGRKNKRSEENKAAAAVTEQKINALLADTYNWYEVPRDFDSKAEPGDLFVQTPEKGQQTVNTFYAAALKHSDFKCVLNKQLCVLPAAAAAAAGRGGYRRSTLRKQVKRPSRRHRIS